MRKSPVVITITLLMLISGFFAINKYIYQQKQAKTAENITSYRGSLTGEYACLPKKDTKGPQTLECVIGMKTDVDEYYALNFESMSQDKPDMQIGDRFTANGIIVPIEMLSTDQWRKYNVEGIFSITDSVQKLP